MTVEIPRDKLIRRMREDLVGPRAPGETLAARASDVYLTGILWPRNTTIAPEEDEQLSATVAGGDNEGDDTPEQAQARSVGMRRPSTAGISFAVATTGEHSASVRVDIEFGTYSPSADGARNHWTRRQNSISSVEIALNERSSDTTLEQYGFPSCVLIPGQCLSNAGCYRR